MKLICLIVAMILFGVAFFIVLVGGHSYTVSHIRELNDAGFFAFCASFLPWKS